MSVYGERVAALEVEIKELKLDMSEYKHQTPETLKDISHKLDTLLALRNKGAGVFWFLSGIMALEFYWSMMVAQHPEDLCNG